jgi:hypothetical protein
VVCYQAALQAERQRLEKLLEKEEALAKAGGPKNPAEASNVDALDAFMHDVAEQMEKDKVDGLFFEEESLKTRGKNIRLQ